MMRAGCAVARFFLLLSMVILGCLCPSAGADCKADPRAKSLDFWLGEWLVTDAQGNRIGSARNTKSKDGCIVTDVFTASEGSTGTGVNVFHAKSGGFTRLFTNDAGTKVVADGTVTNNRFEANGLMIKSDASQRSFKVVFAGVGNNTVDQDIFFSDDDGKTWRSGGTAHYRRK